MRQIDEKGTELFMMQCIEDLEENNPELLQTAHNLASGHRDYLGFMREFRSAV